MAVSRVNKFYKLRAILPKTLISKNQTNNFVLPKTYLTFHRTASKAAASYINKSRRNFNERVCLRDRLHSMPWQSKNFSTTHVQHRKGENFSSEDEDEQKPIGLMDFPQIKWPSVLKSIKNQILAKFIIQMYFDKEFTLENFSIGARQALLVVSSLLRSGNLDGLVGLVSPEAIEEIKRNFHLLSPSHRQWFSLNEDDIYFSFPYQIGIMIDDVDGIQRRQVEITFCYHCLLGLENIRKEGGPTDILKYRENIFIANCRFLKEFTKGVESDWTMNVFNVFKPVMK